MEESTKRDYDQQDHNPQESKNYDTRFFDRAGYNFDFDERNYNDTIEDLDLIPNLGNSRNESRNNPMAEDDRKNAAYGDRANEPRETPGL